MEVTKQMIDWVALLIAVVVTIVVAVLAKYIPNIVFDIVSVIVFAFLLGIWMTALGVPDLSGLVNKIPYLNWVVGIGAGIAFGRLLGKYLPIPGL